MMEYKKLSLMIIMMFCIMISSCYAATSSGAVNTPNFDVFSYNKYVHNLNWFYLDTDNIIEGTWNSFITNDDMLPDIDGESLPVSADVLSNRYNEIIYCDEDLNDFRIIGYNGNSWQQYDTIDLTENTYPDEQCAGLILRTLPQVNSPIFIVNKVNWTAGTNSLGEFYFQKYVANGSEVALSCETNLSDDTLPMAMECYGDGDDTYQHCYVKVVQRSGGGAIDLVGVAVFDQSDCSLKDYVISNQDADAGTYSDASIETYAQQSVILDLDASDNRKIFINSPDAGQTVLLAYVFNTSNDTIQFDTESFTTTGITGTYETFRDFDSDNVKLFNLDIDDDGNDEIIIASPGTNEGIEIVDRVTGEVVFWKSEVQDTNFKPSGGNIAFADANDDGSEEMCWDVSSSSTNVCYQPFGLLNNVYTMTLSKSNSLEFVVLGDVDVDNDIDMCFLGNDQKNVLCYDIINDEYVFNSTSYVNGSVESLTGFMFTDFNFDDNVDLLYWNSTSAYAAFVDDDSTYQIPDYDTDYINFDVFMPVCPIQTVQFRPHVEVEGSAFGMQFAINYKCNASAEYETSDWTVLDEDGFFDTVECDYDEEGFYTFVYQVLELNHNDWNDRALYYVDLTIDEIDCNNATGDVENNPNIINNTEDQIQVSDQTVQQEGVSSFFDELTGGNQNVKMIIAIIIILAIGLSAAQTMGSPIIGIFGGMMGGVLCMVLGLIPVWLMILIILIMIAVWGFSRIVFNGNGE